MTNRCEVCEEPKFMCSCNKHHADYKGEEVVERYHHGKFFAKGELMGQLFTGFIYETIQGRK